MHDSAVWTTRSTDIANMMDATVVCAEDNFLVATFISPRLTIAAIKSDYCDPTDTISRFVNYLVVLRHPVVNPKSHYADMDMELMGRERPLHHLLAELFSQPPLQY